MYVDYLRINEWSSGFSGYIMMLKLNFKWSFDEVSCDKKFENRKESAQIMFVKCFDQ